MSKYNYEFNDPGNDRFISNNADNTLQASYPNRKASDPTFEPRVKLAWDSPVQGLAHLVWLPSKTATVQGRCWVSYSGAISIFSGDQLVASWCDTRGLPRCIDVPAATPLTYRADALFTIQEDYAIIWNAVIIDVTPTPPPPPPVLGNFVFPQSTSIPTPTPYAYSLASAPANNYSAYSFVDQYTETVNTWDPATFSWFLTSQSLPSVVFGVGTAVNVNRVTIQYSGAGPTSSFNATSPGNYYQITMPNGVVANSTYNSTTFTVSNSMLTETVMIDYSTLGSLYAVGTAIDVLQGPTAANGGLCWAQSLTAGTTGPPFIPGIYFDPLSPMDSVSVTTRVYFRVFTPSASQAYPAPYGQPYLPYDTIGYTTTYHNLFP